jgi:hypothetical protein
MGTPAPSIAAGGKRYIKSCRASERRSTTTRPLAASGLRRFLVVAAVSGALFAVFGYALGPETERSLQQIRSLVATSEPAVMLRAETRTAEASDRIVDDVADRSGMPSLVVGLAALVIIAASAFLYPPGRHPRTKSRRGPNR